MKPQDIQRINEHLNRHIDPFASSQLFKNYADIISKIEINRIPPVYRDFTNIAESINMYFQSHTLKNIEELIGSTTKISQMFEKSSSLNEILGFYNYDFSEIIEEFNDEDEITAKENPKVRDVIIKETESLQQIIFDIYLNNQKLYELSPRNFEKIIAELLSEKGFEVELTKQTRDNGYDILALKHIKDFSPVKYLVECKKYSPERKIGVEIIRSFKDVILTEKANKGIIVTTSYFSRDAIKKQTESPLLLDYKNKDELMEWVNDYYKRKANR